MPSTAQMEADLQPRRKGRPRTSETAAPSLVDILNLVRTERATTRQELERESELGRAVVADRLGTLADLALVDESELGAATGGRAPRLVRFSANRGSILVATLDQTALGVGIADLGGRLKMEHHEAADLTQPVSALTDRLITLFRWILEMQHFGARRRRRWRRILLSAVDAAGPARLGKLSDRRETGRGL